MNIRKPKLGQNFLIDQNEKQHWPALQMLLADPDGRHIAVEAPLPSTKKGATKNRAAKKR